jgi:hypothetical protein
MFLKTKPRNIKNNFFYIFKQDFLVLILFYNNLSYHKTPITF